MHHFVGSKAFIGFPKHCLHQFLLLRTYSTEFQADECFWPTKRKRRGKTRTPRRAQIAQKSAPSELSVFCGVKNAQIKLLHRIVIGDKKWCFYANFNPSRSGRSKQHFESSKTYNSRPHTAQLTYTAILELAPGCEISCILHTVRTSFVSIPTFPLAFKTSECHGI